MAEEGAGTAIALVHHPVRDRQRGTGSTSVTPLNIHDLARSATTFGVAPLYVVTPIESQQALAERILRHWLEGHGGVQNPSRKESLGIVKIVASVNDAAGDLMTLTGRYPLLVGTAARGGEGAVSFEDLRGELSTSPRPALILLGTGWGLTPELLDQCDRLLEPIPGRGNYNHLSVRSAAAIILDRLFGS
jgi:hypothetical protein